jgi:hypothetical protein
MWRPQRSLQAIFRFASLLSAHYDHKIAAIAGFKFGNSCSIGLPEKGKPIALQLVSAAQSW